MSTVATLASPCAPRTLVKRALETKDELIRPTGSQFRVICAIEYKYADAQDEDSYETIFGSNIETVTLCGGVCAERSALTALRSRARGRDLIINQMAIVTDAKVPIFPGCMCREFMCEHYDIYD